MPWVQPVSQNARVCGAELTMSSKKTISKNSLLLRVEQLGVVCYFPCSRCGETGKTCIKAEFSKRCNECIRANNCRCVDMPVSDLAWKRLAEAQEKIEADEEKAREEVAALMARLSRLQKQKKLLRKRAGQFIQTDIKDVEELEKLEEEEERKAAEDRAKQEAVRKEQELIASMLNSDDPSGLVVDDSSWFAAFSSSNQLSLDTPESYRGNSNS